MSAEMLKKIGLGCILLTLILAFVATERYYANVQSIKNLNDVNEYFFRSIGGYPKWYPKTPSTTIYAVFGAVLSLVGGVTCLFLARKKQRASLAVDEANQLSFSLQSWKE